MQAMRFLALVAQFTAVLDPPDWTQHDLVILGKLPSGYGCFSAQLLAAMSILAQLTCIPTITLQRISKQKGHQEQDRREQV